MQREVDSGPMGEVRDNQGIYEPDESSNTVQCTKIQRQTKTNLVYHGVHVEQPDLRFRLLDMPPPALLQRNHHDSVDLSSERPAASPETSRHEKRVRRGPGYANLREL